MHHRFTHAPLSMHFLSSDYSQWATCWSWQQIIFDAAPYLLLHIPYDTVTSRLICMQVGRFLYLSLVSIWRTKPQLRRKVARRLRNILMWGIWGIQLYSRCERFMLKLHTIRSRQEMGILECCQLSPLPFPTGGVCTQCFAQHIIIE